MSKELQELLSAHIKEGAEIDFSEYVDLDKANETYNNHINGIVKKNTEKSVEKYRSEFEQSFIKDLGIEAENLDGVKLWAKKMNGSTDEFKETNIKLEKELNELKEKYNLTTQEFNGLKSELKVKNEIALINSKGVTGEDAEFLHFKLSKQVTEEKDFAALLEEYIKETKPDVKDTHRFKKDRFNGGEEVAESIRKKYPNYFKN